MGVDVVDRNRLADATSPYLTAHADNPVHWQPWDETALAAARRRDVPIFLSIGYAACHWCHVMADESFEDEAVAEMLNTRYVPIKVDREERPDLDRYYQTAVQLASGRGGWPLSAWLTPDGRPFQLATYLPKEPRRGQPGFLELLERIAERWETDRASIESRADSIVDAIRDVREVDEAAGPVDRSEWLEPAAQTVLRSIDWEHGGFGSGGPKFPQESRLTLLLWAWQRTGRERYGDAVETTLDAMANGGLYDHVGGGFHRYSTDARWHVPHFEKMAYDNANLLGLYARAADILERDRYRHVVDGTATFLLDELRHPAGGFYCSLDADIDGEEGATYAWTAEELEEAIDDPTLRELLSARFGIEDRTDIPSGCVLQIDRSIEDLAGTFDRSTTRIRADLERGIGELQAARDDRPQPDRDEKVLAAWTGLVSSGFSLAGAHLDDPRYLDIAESALGFIDEHLWHPETGRLHRTFRDGTVVGPGFLEDYGAVARAAFDHYWASDSLASLRFGLEVSDAMLDTCWDGAAGRFRFVPEGESDLPDDPLDPLDRSIPSPLGLAVDSLVTADAFRTDERIATAIETTLATYGQPVARGPLDHATLTMAFERWMEGPPTVTIVADEIPPTWRRQLHRRGREVLVTRRPPGDRLGRAVDRLGLPDVPPVWADRPPVDDAPTIYPCRGLACGPPQVQLEDAIDWFDEE